MINVSCVLVGSVDYRVGELFGWVLLGILVVGITLLLFQRRQKRLHSATSVTPAWVPVERAGASALPTKYVQVGWHQLGSNPNEQMYWDGQSWTAFRRWTAGRGWSESANVTRR
jgi:hypothetical protein